MFQCIQPATPAGTLRIERQVKMTQPKDALAALSRAVDNQVAQREAAAQLRRERQAPREEGVERADSDREES